MKIKHLIVAGLCALACVQIATPAVAGSQEPWTIAETMGDVKVIRSGAALVSLKTDDELQALDVIETGPGSRAVLVRGSETIMMAPNSRMSLPEDPEPGFTRIFQDAGTLLFSVGKKGRKHFEVETPYLAGVVKGTTFTVNADANGGALHVLEGAVEVKALDSGEIRLVHPGETARVSSAADARLRIHKSSKAPRFQSNEGEATGDSIEGSPDNSGASEGGPKAHQNDQGRDSEIVEANAQVIPEALGVLEIDLSTLTNGLVRTASYSPSASGQSNNGSTQAEDGWASSIYSELGSSRNVITTASILTTTGTPNVINQTNQVPSSGSAVTSSTTSTSTTSSGTSSSGSTSSGSGSGASTTSSGSTSSGSGSGTSSTSNGGSSSGNGGNPWSWNGNGWSWGGNGGNGGSGSGGGSGGGNSQGENGQGENSQGENNQGENNQN